MKAAEGSDEDMVGALSSIYSSRAVGKDVQMDIDTHGPAQASQQEVSANQQLCMAAVSVSPTPTLLPVFKGL
jgi:hypothetical protein